MNRTTRFTALILGDDALGAALLGAAVETFGVAVEWPNLRESPHEAVRRLRPRLVLLDVDRDDIRHRGFVGPAVMRGAAVVLYGTPRSAADVGTTAARLGVPSITLPDGLRELEAFIGALHGDPGGGA